MLTHLRISDFALLDDVELALGPGFNVLTGETGAGKSLLVEAVALLRGGRASAEVVRAGAEEARIEALFEPVGSAAVGLAERLAKAGIEPAEEGLVVRRVIGKSGRGRVYINGALSTAANLAELAGGLIDLAGQHEHQTLTDPARHLAALDAHGVAPSLLAAVAEAHARLGAAAEALAATQLDERARAEREDFLRFQLKELEEADLQAGEDATLKAERERLRADEKLHGAAQRAEQALYAREGAIVEELGALGRELAEVGRSDPALAGLGARLEEARVTLEDLADSFRRYADGMNGDPERLAEVEERLHLVTKLLRKHGAPPKGGGAGGPQRGTDIAEVLARQAAMASELEALGRSEERRAEAERALEEARRAAAKAATALSEARHEAAARLAADVSRMLGELSMGGACLTVDVTHRAAREGDDPALLFDGRRLGPSGWDRAEFLLAANQGEEARPLGRVASGGELSRVMLALKRVLARADTVGTYVFDEVDSGIGGAVAHTVGRLLGALGADRQVLAVTHLAQVAAAASRHLQVDKASRGGRTFSSVRALDRQARVLEIARMLGGDASSEVALAHAREILQAAVPVAAAAPPRPRRARAKAG